MLETRTLLAADFGDAPAPYPTLLADNGARHEELGPMLGATRDTEADGAPSAAADGDGVDEDGVTFGTLQVGALGASVTVNVQGGSGLLDAWVDFNGDGTWGGPGEQIFASHAVAEGNNDLTFDVPSWAKDGETFARFRLSSSGALGPKGAAADGEVEDYAVSIVPPAPSSAVFAPQSIISTTADSAETVAAADLDGDGDMDVLSASKNDSTIAWYENDGSESFAEHAISTTAGGARAVTVADVDGDGDLDVLSASSWDSKISWYENDGSESFTQHVISTTAENAWWVDVADMEGDGDLDVLSASRNDDKIAWYENDGSQVFTEHVIATTADQATSVSTGDIDRDGDLDVVSGSIEFTKLTWYENDGTQNFEPHNLPTRDIGSVEDVAVVDLDEDDDMDFVAATYWPSSDADDGTVQWFENTGDVRLFDEHEILYEGYDREIATFPADMDGDGDFDVVASSGFNPRINLLLNDGNQTFLQRPVSNAVSYPYSVIAADIDSDGDLDIVSASEGDDKIAWYKNITPPTLVTNTGLKLDEGTISGISSAQLSVTAIGSTPDQVVFTVVLPPAHGQLELTTAPGVTITNFTQADINAGLLLYRHDGSDPTSDSFQFTVSDQEGETLPTTSFHLLIIQDTPTLITNVGLMLAEGSSSVITSDRLSAASVGNTPDQLVYSIVVLPTRGQLELTSAPGEAVTTFTQADIDAGDLLYRHNGSESLSDVFKFTISDSEGDTLPSTSFGLIVTPVNDAPVLDTTLNPVLTATHEDALQPEATYVGQLVRGVTDVDANARRGIAITGASSYSGRWQFNTFSLWQDMGAVSETAALLLRSAAFTYVRFIPNPDFHGTVKLYYRAWDQTEGLEGRKVNLVEHTGGTTAFSTAEESASLRVSPVNDAPVLDIALDPVLQTITEDDFQPPGTMVADLLSGVVTDVDANALRGIAVTAASSGAGNWQFSSDGGMAWQEMGAVAETAARLLAESSRVRFVPNADFNGTVTLDYRAWDQTQGDVGGTLNLEGNTGGTSAVSANKENATLTVTPVADAPVLDTSLDPALRSTSEDTLPPASMLVADMLKGAVSDGDGDALRGIAVTAASSYWGIWQFSTDNGKNWSEMGVVSESAVGLLPDTARVRFTPKANFNGTVKLYYRAWDQTEGRAGQTFNLQGHTGGSTAFSVAKENASLLVKPVNDAPVLKLSGTVSYVHDSWAIVLAPNAMVSDVDSLNFYQGSLRVRITDGASWTNRLEISGGFRIDANNRLLYGTTVIGQRVSDGVGRSDLIFNFNAKATPAIVQELIRGIKFKTVNGLLGTRTLLFSVFDGDGGVSTEARKTVLVT
jgi:hypothetical protein